MPVSSAVDDQVKQDVSLPETPPDTSVKPDPTVLKPDSNAADIKPSAVDSPVDPINQNAPLVTEPDAGILSAEPLVKAEQKTEDSGSSESQGESQGSSSLGTDGLPPLVENPNKLSTREILTGNNKAVGPTEITPDALPDAKLVTATNTLDAPQSEVTDPESKSLKTTDVTNVLPQDSALQPLEADTGGPYPYTIDQLLDLVIQKDASDLHISAGYPVMIRVDGDLSSISPERLTPETSKDLIYSMLPDDIKEVVEVSKEADLAHAHKDLARFRVNVYHAKGSMCAAFRLIPRRIRSIEELKLPSIYKEFAALKQGLVLVTGPTGHGKSTTLASILNEVNKTRPVHILTIEDPIEYVYPREKALVCQREMKNDTHSWEIALRSALREDPDVVLVGEMRDYETIAAAITVAETGHLVFATLHTNSAAQTIDRIIDVFPEHQQSQIRTQLATVIEAVVSQRLVKLIGGGRRAVSEVMLGSPAVRNIIREGKTYQLDNTIRTSSDIGMISIEKSLVELVREGVLSVEDAQAYAISPEEVVRLLK
ncbi:type IV pilus twitching motility protein PilT [Candidatus Dojkabacteria bacterium]|nr:type IV pilus twitching motility protein PilT [Candidatus Dojkabacteria bacterium]